MSNSTKTKKFTLLHKPHKGQMPVLLIVFAWIALWNVIFQIVHHSWHELPIVNWAFFISVTIFFMQEELTMKQKFWHTLVGGSVGLLLAAGITLGAAKLIGLGVDSVTSVCIPLVIVIAMLILLHPYLPLFFNNVGFCYLVIAFVEADKMMEMLPNYLLSLLLGSIILNLGCIGLLTLYGKMQQKKASAATATK